MLSSFALYFTLTHFALLCQSQDFRCCSQTNLALCNRACLQAGRSGRLLHRYNRIKRACSGSQRKFWSCINTTWKIARAKFAHNTCCFSARTASCAVECFLEENVNHAKGFCSHQIEADLRSCLNRYEIANECCSTAKTEDCKSHCTEVIMSNSNGNSWLESSFDKFCQNSTSVPNCIFDNYEGIRGSKYLKCCAFGHSAVCRKSCRKLFTRNIKESNLVPELNKVCGPSNPQDELYHCLLDVVSSKDERPLQDQCCVFAKSRTCRSWCSRGFSKTLYVGSDDPLYIQCMENPSEYELSTCIADVLEPCKFGCKDKLSFCSNFNNRPLELFRRCDSVADQAAKKIYDSWRKGEHSYVPLPSSAKEIFSCEPELWKALACTLAIKPCSRTSNRNQICRSDCVSLLKKCLKQSHLISKAEKTCMMLMPNPDQTDCVTSTNYVTGRNESIDKFATFPCQNDPCKERQVCSINEECSFGRNSESCRPYKCLPGCALRSSPNVKIRHLDFFKVPVAENGKTCYQVCQCIVDDSHSKYIDSASSCTQIGCHHTASCKVRNGFKDHKSSFSIDGNICTCYDGEVICTKISAFNEGQELAGFACACDSDIYNPVCAINGMTYPSICHARCTGLQDEQILPGACMLENSCSTSPCPSKLVCMPNRRVCLLSTLVCPQYDCVQPQQTLEMVEPCLLDYEQTEECKEEPLFKYCCKGSCHSKFNRAPVCGVDGVAYSSYCDAANFLVLVDYKGQCVTDQDELPKRDRCKSIKCTTKGSSNCKTHIPIGGCCPICEPLIRILYSQRDAEVHIEKISPKPVIVRDFLEQLSTQLLVSECIIRGYLSIEGDIVVIVKSNLKLKNMFQIKICEREAERITNLINSRSPLISTNYYLSIARAAFIIYPSDKSPNRAKRRLPALLLIPCTLFVVYILTK
ncbi:reversion-inducing cysteine-rich protein with Kazal motifs-like isoform X2 [Rhopilema esculentum]|uniref:reversion-inducing cysteine-rich protein with Kazal motifs-like isoform X2 n=1 Tax=Rhopilema esculentum TaxID=499914 RepID=UPI0031D01388